MKAVKKNPATRKQLQKLFFGKYEAWLEDQLFIPNALRKYAAFKPTPITVKEWDAFFAWHFRK